MNEFAPRKLSISYSHHDEGKIRNFIKHLAPLKENGLISEWYDRKIMPGQDLQYEIDNNLYDADIICLCISKDFLASPECKKEKVNAIKLKRKKVISVIPIILSDCGWLDDKDISPLLALPTDGKPISKFGNADAAWKDVYQGLKRVIENENKIGKLKLSEEFLSFLQNVELLTKAHSRKEEVLLDDIFVYPKLAKYDDLKEYEKKESSEKLLEEFGDYSKILLSGENQSGKTTFCKKLYLELHRKRFVPIYISCRKSKYYLKIKSKIAEEFKKQYTGEIPFEDIDDERIVPLIDDFHFATDKEKLLEDLSTYHNQIVIVDDIFRLNVSDKGLIHSFKHFKVEEFSPSLRNKLIKKWVQLADKNRGFPQNQNSIYQNIDQTTELVDAALGKITGSGIMPAYPFFILTVINVYETFLKPLNEEITSQGYCYEALIYQYLMKQGVKTDDIDTYINFLSELAFHIFKTQRHELSANDFSSFMSSYTEKYNLPIKEETLLLNLQQTRIFSSDDFRNYSFDYPYLYFFFVAKYLAEHLEDNKETIKHLIDNLHDNYNAYITVFISHHSRNHFILEEVIRTASSLFKEYAPSTLARDELSFFDEQANVIAQATLPAGKNMPEQERNRDLRERDKLEQNSGGIEKPREKDEDDRLLSELRRSVKTVEVMGTIIKNRAGSLEKDKLTIVFKEGMNVHLRILKSFIEGIKGEEDQQSFINFISAKLELIIRNKKSTPTPRKLQEMAKIIFWNLNFVCVYFIIDKVIRSLGSNKLTEIIEKVCHEDNTPATTLIMHGIFMWHQKNLQIDAISNRMKADDFSEIAKNVLKHRVVDHYRIHSVGYKERLKIRDKLEIPIKFLPNRPV